MLIAFHSHSKHDHHHHHQQQLQYVSAYSCGPRICLLRLRPIRRFELQIVIMQFKLQISDMPLDAASCTGTECSSLGPQTVIIRGRFQLPLTFNNYTADLALNSLKSNSPSFMKVHAQVWLPHQLLIIAGVESMSQLFGYLGHWRTIEWDVEVCL